MRRIVLSALIVLMLCPPAWALKKTLLFLPGNEYMQTGWMRAAITYIVIEGGGNYECVYMNADTTGIGARLAAYRAAGDIGLAVFMCYQQTSSESDITNTGAGYENYGLGKFSQYCSFGATGSATLGIPTIVCSSKGLSRSPSASFRCGATCDNTWTASEDSLWAETSAGDTILWYKTNANYYDRKHILDIDGAPESAYSWEVDYYTKVGAAATSVTPSNGASVYMWHAHASAYDAAQTPGAGQDSVIYYLPNWNTVGTQAGWDSEIKAIAGVLKKFNCIKEIPFSIHIYDFGFSGQTSAAILAGADSFLQYCSDRLLPVTAFVQYCSTDTATIVPFMARWYDDPYVHFGWHPSNLFREADRGATYQIFAAWGDDSNETADSLLEDLVRDKYLLGTSGMLQYMKEADFVAFASGDYNGVYPSAGVNQTDTIMSALAACGARKFSIETPFSAYYPVGAAMQTIFYSCDNYPLDLTWTGDAQVVKVSFIQCWYQALGTLTGGADTLRADPGALTPLSILEGSVPISSMRLYSYFDRSIFSNGRIKDASGTNWSTMQSDWPHRYNLASRGWVWYCEPNDFYRSNGGVRYNMALLWLQHNWNNLRAYNNVAKQDDSTIGNVFNAVFISDADQTPGLK